MNCLRPEHPWARRARNARLTIRGTSRVTMRIATMRIATVAEPDPA